MADQDDRRGVFAILANGLGGDQSANRELIDGCGKAGMLDLVGQAVHSAREEWAQRATEQIDATARLHRGRPRDHWRHDLLARHRGRTRFRRIEADKDNAGGEHRADHEGCNLRRTDHALPACAVKHRHVNYPRRASINHTGSSAAFVADEWAGFEAPLRRAMWKSIVVRRPGFRLPSLEGRHRSARLYLEGRHRSARLCSGIYRLGEGDLATLACACAAAAGRLKA